MDLSITILLVVTGILAVACFGFLLYDIIKNWWQSR